MNKPAPDRLLAYWIPRDLTNPETAISRLLQPGHSPPSEPWRVVLDQSARRLGFSATGVSRPQLPIAAHRLNQWLELGYHGTMTYLSKYGLDRANPARWFPETIRVISVACDYGKPDPSRARLLQEPARAYIAQYALGRDYHRVMRKKLGQLAEELARYGAPHGYRVFVDSGPVMEKPLAQNAGLGWMGKHTNLIAPKAGSYFFLGEILTTLPLMPDLPGIDHCGHCRACLDVCPTRAIVKPYQLDARRCISYLTIENRGPIPVELRPLIGNRIFGCDDCQLVCPMNKFARKHTLPEFAPRTDLLAPELAPLLKWSAAEFDEKTRGSALRRAGYLGWLRNVAVALGNAPGTPEVMAALSGRANHPDSMVREHVAWALSRHRQPTRNETPGP